MRDQELLFMYVLKTEAPDALNLRGAVEKYRVEKEPGTTLREALWRYTTDATQTPTPETQRVVAMAHSWWNELPMQERTRYEVELYNQKQATIIKTEVQTSRWPSVVTGWVAGISIVVVLYFVYLKRPGRWI